MKILFVYREKFSFVETDLQLLRTSHEVRELKVDYRFPQILRVLSEFVLQTLWADLVFSWFGSHHALLPFLLARVLGRRRVIIASGFDVANFPEIEYGDMRPGIKRPLGILVYKLADKVFPVSDYTLEEILQNIPVNKQKLIRIYHGFPANGNAVHNQKQDMVVTIGAVTHNNLLRKGLEAFVRAAKYLPNTRFILVGKSHDEALRYLMSIATPNVEFPGFVDNLSPLLTSAKVYVQASYHEAFGCSVAEAMLYGCIPVVTQRGALPEVAGNTGVYVPFGDAEKLAIGIHQALSMNWEIGLAARRRVLEQFSLETRRQSLLAEIDSIVNNHGYNSRKEPLHN